MSMAIAQHNLAESTLIVAAKDHIGCSVGGEEVILNLSSGTYYGLNKLGSHIWGLVQKPHSVGEIVESVLSEYDTDRTKCENDIHMFLTELLEKGLVEISS